MYTYRIGWPEKMKYKVLSSSDLSCLCRHEGHFSVVFEGKSRKRVTIQEEEKWSMDKKEIVLVVARSSAKEPSRAESHGL